MAPLSSGMPSLGHKHREHNRHVKAVLGDDTWTLTKIDYSAPDVDNLLKIDVACTRRDIQYVLEVLRSDDMLYISRAIKNSTWLITDKLYTHIINPKYLNDELFPQMTSKAKCKLILSIRLHLKDETRNEEFFNFYKDDFEIALKWLVGCSPSFIESIVEKYANKIDGSSINRLCEKSFKVLKIYCQKSNNYYKKNLLQKTMFLLKDNTEEFLDIVDEMESYMKPRFGKKATQILMKKCPNRITDNFNKYCFLIDLQSFAEHIKKEEIRDFLLKQKRNDKVKDSWFSFENLKHFLKLLPKEGRYELITELTTENVKTNPKVNFRALKCSAGLCNTSISRPTSSNAHVYKWYRFASFDVAFVDLKKLINVESSPVERNAILTILIGCASSNKKHLQTLLEFYREKHINEPFKYKVQFVNALLSKTKLYLFDEELWTILNNIFSSMETYMESENNVQYCVEAIIVYNLLRNNAIPEIIEKKFIFNTLRSWANKLNKNIQGKLFTYLYDKTVKDLSKNVFTENEFEAVVNATLQILTLIKDWNRNIKDYPIVIDTIKRLIKIKEDNSWDINMTSLYNTKKEWKKYMFTESLILDPSHKTCINALKHDPSLLCQNKAIIESLWTKDTLSMRYALRKIRSYWPESLGQEWANGFLERLQTPKGQKAIIAGVCVLTPREKLLPLIQKYIPKETKINWYSDNVDLNLIKYIAMSLHLVRPAISLETVLLYAKDDYLRHALSSLNAVLHDISSQETAKCINKLLNSPVSLQKHGIRVAIQKLKVETIKDSMQKVWKNTKNSSIKTVLFQQTFQLLCKEKKDSIVKDIWEIIKMYIADLSNEENRLIYNILGQIHKVPYTVRPEFYVKSYLYLKSLPSKADCESLIKNLEREASKLIHLLEPSFVEDVLLKSAEEIIITKNFNSNFNSTYHILASYLLSCKSEEIQIKKYDKVLVPLMNNSFSIWQSRHKGNYFVKKNITSFLEELISGLKKYTLTKNNVIPVKLFKNIQLELIKTLKAEENFKLLTEWNIATLFVEILNDYVKNKGTTIEVEANEMEEDGCEPDINQIWDTTISNIASLFGSACFDLLNRNTFLNKYPSLYSNVSDILVQLFYSLNISVLNKYQILKSLLSDPNASIMYCIVIDYLADMDYCTTSNEKVIEKEILNIIQSNKSTEVQIHFSLYDNNKRRDSSSSS